MSQKPRGQRKRKTLRKRGVHLLHELMPLVVDMYLLRLRNADCGKGPHWPKMKLFLGDLCTGRYELCKGVLWPVYVGHVSRDGHLAPFESPRHTMRQLCRACPRNADLAAVVDRIGKLKRVLQADLALEALAR